MVPAAFDITGAIETVFASVTTDLGGALAAIAPAIIGLAAVVLIWRRLREMIVGKFDD
jgi:hypothetical protein